MDVQTVQDHVDACFQASLAGIDLAKCRKPGVPGEREGEKEGKTRGDRQGEKEQAEEEETRKGERKRKG